MKIFITGASGFVGGAVTQALVADHHVFAMARSDRSAERVERLGAIAIRSDLATISAADLPQVDLVIHAAARAEEWGSYNAFYQANVEGTRNILKAAREGGVLRFIHVGTEAAMYEGQDLENIDESYPYALESSFPYAKTKALAEQLVLAANAPDFQTLSIRPRLVWGPGDQTVLPAVTDMLSKGAFAWVNHGQALTSTTHIDNLVHAIVLAMDNGKGGEAYFVSDNEALSYKAFLTQLVATQGLVVPEKNVPAGVLKVLAWLAEKSWAAFRVQSKPPLSRMAAAMLASTCTLNISKAQRELGYSPVKTLAQGFEEMRIQYLQ